MWNFNVTELLFVFLEDWTDALITSKMSKKIKVSRKLGGGNTKNFVCSDHSRNNTWNKIGESSQNEEG